jgi:plastocyanin
MRRLSLVLVAVALAAPASAHAAAVPAVAALKCPKTFGVTVGDKGSRLFFSKDLLTVGKGACVRWTWTGEVTHKVVTPDGLRSATRKAPYTYRRRFSRPRARPYKIFCAVHPTMTMKIKVLDSAAR